MYGRGREGGGIAVIFFASPKAETVNTEANLSRTLLTVVGSRKRVRFFTGHVQ